MREREDITAEIKALRARIKRRRAIIKLAHDEQYTFHERVLELKAERALIPRKQRWKR